MTIAIGPSRDRLRSISTLDLLLEHLDDGGVDGERRGGDGGGGSGRFLEFPILAAAWSGEVEQDGASGVEGVGNVVKLKPCGGDESEDFGRRVAAALGEQDVVGGDWIGRGGGGGAVA